MLKMQLCHHMKKIAYYSRKQLFKIIIIGLIHNIILFTKKKKT